MCVCVCVCVCVYTRTSCFVVVSAFSVETLIMCMYVQYIILYYKGPTTMNIVTVETFMSGARYMSFAHPCDRIGDTRWLSWFRHWATSRRISCSITDDGTGIFQPHNPSGRTMVLVSTQPLTEVSFRNISWGVKAAGTYSSQPYHFHDDRLEIWQP